MSGDSRLLNKLNRKFGKIAIPNLMSYIVVAMGVVFIMDLLLGMKLTEDGTVLSITEFLRFDRALLFKGQVWRLISFIFIPPDSGIIFIIFSLYFYFLMGRGLEREWGAYRFNLFYFSGVLFTVIAGMLTGYATNYYLNMSLFLAFAALYPNFEMLIFFILPVKIKYLAYIDLAWFVFSLITARGWRIRVAIAISLLNVALFFWRDIKSEIMRIYRKAKYKRQFRN